MADELSNLAESKRSSAPSMNDPVGVIEPERAVRALRRRITALLALRAFVRLSTAWLLLWGVGVLIVRTLSDAHAAQLALGGLGLLVTALVAGAHAWRHRPEPARLRALLDQHHRCGGLLMSAHLIGEPIPAHGESAPHHSQTWRDRLPPVEAVGLRWRAGRPLAALTVALSFVAAGFLMPVDSVAARAAERMDVNRPVAELREQIDLLEQTHWLEDEDVRGLAEDLGQLDEAATGDKPTPMWEALDHMRERVDQAGDTAAEQALAEAAETAQMRVLAEALAEEGHQLEAGLEQRAMEELTEMVSAAMAENNALREQLGERLAGACESGGLSREQLDELAERLRARQDAIEQMMQRMQEASLTDRETLAQCEALGQCEGGGFCAFANEHGEAYSFGQMLDAWILAGGGISDEGGLSPMTFRDEPVDEADARFEPEMLPSDRRDVRDSELVGLGAATPEVDEESRSSTGGALEGASSAGGRGDAQRVLPRHRQAVEHYFDRDEH